MKLLVIRHGPAGDREAWAASNDEPDEVRPLTPGGVKRTRAAARGLAREVGRIDLLATSPLVRASQTAEIVSAAFGGVDGVALDALRPDRHPEELAGWLAGLPAEQVAAVVGHEPHLGTLVGWLLTGDANAFLELKKPGVALLEFDGPPSGGNARLRWVLAPRHLRALAR
jgi:phosphohistidine phosphatase